MNTGWIKIHRKLLDNHIYKNDPTAWRVFFHLLLSVDHKTGSCTFGRKQLALQIGNNENTVYKAIKRLLVTGMVTQESNNRFTTYYICKWHEYQGIGNSQSNRVGNTSGNNRPPVSVTHYKNILITKNKEIYNVETQKVYDHYIKLFNKNSNSYKLTDKRKVKIRQRIKDIGLDRLLQAITNASQNEFYSGNNDREWVADLDYITRSYEVTEKLANLSNSQTDKEVDLTKYL